MKVTKKIAWALALVLMVVTPTLGQPTQMGHGMPGVAEFENLSENEVIKVPFELVNNHILLPVSVDGSPPFKAILDTGMPMGGLILFDSDKVEDLELKFSGMEARIGGAGGTGEHVQARVALDSTLTLPGLKIKGTPVVVMPGMPSFFGYHQGIIGTTLFDNFVVELDYQKSEMTLYPPGSYQASSDATVVPLSFEHKIAFVDGTVTMTPGSVVKVRLAVDTGASNSLTLNTDTDEKIQVPEKAVPATLGHGASGKIEGSVGRVAGFELNGVTLKNVVTNFPVSKHQRPGHMEIGNGILGNDIMKRFKVTFDYSRKRMYLEPGPSFGEPFEFNMSGLQIGGLNDKGILISGVIPGSPAEEAGIKTDDVLTHINGRPASEIQVYEIRWMLREEGAEVTVGIVRDHKEIEKKLRLRRLV